MVDEDFTQLYQHLDNLREGCKRGGVSLPESIYDASAEILKALSASHGDEEGAMELLVAKFKRGAKREHAATAKARETERAIGDAGEETPVDLEEDEVGDENIAANEGEEPPRKVSRLTEDVRKEPAAVFSNQVIVNTFADYGEQQLHQGHTGTGVTHLRAACAIRDYPRAIESGTEARAVPLVGSKMATQIEQLLSSGKLEDKLKLDDVEKHTLPELVHEVHETRAKCSENQILVDELSKFGEHELNFRSVSKGMTHLRAARELQLTNQVVSSGDQARREVPLVGATIADKIDQILKYGRIVKDIPVAGRNIQPELIVEERAVRPENQFLVDALVDYGSSHSHSGHAGKGVAHLRAAMAIRDSDIVVTSGKQAAESIKYVGAQIGAKIDQLLEHGHADTDDEVDDQDDQGSEFGVREPSGTPRIVHEVRSKQARVEGNQKIVDALSDRGEMQLAQCHTGQGTASMRAACRLRDTAELVTSGTVAQALGCIGNKVATFIDALTCQSPDEAEDITEVAEK
ncbi:Helix-hairpin-helix motif-containing protein 8 [Phytophthora infestans]|uniref:Helix-hairpin-helix motif-containing protein 8 n=1 Tax=Phytophthora infestans TaxID=4787 RepID=A0A833SXB6_PHYIN|nr:Helix-hairpin-helix motif-containing protein 8 [Phytophthora infestans]